MPRPFVPVLITPGIIARDGGHSLTRVLYVLRTRPDIRPSARAGMIRLYDRHAVKQVIEELMAINARRVSRESGVTDV